MFEAPGASRMYRGGGEVAVQGGKQVGKGEKKKTIRPDVTYASTTAANSGTKKKRGTLSEDQTDNLDHLDPNLRI